MTINWRKPCSYNPEQKIIFHRGAKCRLRLLAKQLNFDKQDYEIRSNQGGIAVSGEVILHHENVYIHVSLGSLGILIRQCDGRKDFTGGPNTWLPLHELDSDLTKLVAHVKKILSPHVLNS